MLTKTAVLFLTGALLGTAALSAAESGDRVSNGVVAINVLLRPDHGMSARAQEINRMLRENYAVGFALDASHVPHISILHRYVRAKDLPEIYAAVERVAAKHPLIGQQLTVKGLEHTPWQGHQVTTINVEKTTELEAMQSALVAALLPYAVESGDSNAFLTSSEEPQVGQQTIDYVKTFVDKQTGDRFKPHITVGISDAETADKVAAQPVEPMKFKVASVAIYQLGDVGTARQELWHYSPR